MSDFQNKPLCPHCFRSACPWLGSYRFQPNDTPDIMCPFYRQPLPPRIRKMLTEAMERSCPKFEGGS